MEWPSNTLQDALLSVYHFVNGLLHQHVLYFAPFLRYQSCSVPNCLWPWSRSVRGQRQSRTLQKSFTFVNKYEVTSLVCFPNYVYIHRAIIGWVRPTMGFKQQQFPTSSFFFRVLTFEIYTCVENWNGRGKFIQLMRTPWSVQTKCDWILERKVNCIHVI